MVATVVVECYNHGPNVWKTGMNADRERAKNTLNTEIKFRRPTAVYIQSGWKIQAYGTN